MTRIIHETRLGFELHCTRPHRPIQVRVRALISVPATSNELSGPGRPITSDHSPSQFHTPAPVGRNKLYRLQFQRKASHHQSGAVFANQLHEHAMHAVVQYRHGNTKAMASLAWVLPVSITRSFLAFSTRRVACLEKVR